VTAQVASSAVLEIGGSTGALVVYADEQMVGREVEICAPHDPGPTAHNVVRKRQTSQGPVFAAVFPTVDAGEYVVLGSDGSLSAPISVLGGAVSEVDCRIEVLS
jgi:hypothetical protein